MDFTVHILVISDLWMIIMLWKMDFGMFCDCSNVWSAFMLTTGQFCDCKDCSGKYVLIRDEEDPRLAMFDKPLPCFGCGIGWCSWVCPLVSPLLCFLTHLIGPLTCSLLIGFVCPLIWFYAAILYLRKYYNKDPRERSGLTAAACMVSLSIVTSIYSRHNVLISTVSFIHQPASGQKMLNVGRFTSIYYKDHKHSSSDELYLKSHPEFPI